MAELISIAEAQRLVLERARPLEAERVPIERAAGRVLAETAAAAADLPPFPSSAMDGYAVRAADTAGAPVTLPVVERIAAGSPASRGLASGETMAIATGGVVPEGADAVVPLEVVEETADGLVVGTPVSAGANVRGRGGDVRAGEGVLSPGTRLGAAQVAALAAAGVAEVRCAKRPRVGILVTGSELRPPGSPLAPGQIYESNGLLLATALALAGAVPAQLGAVPDDREEHRRAMERALLGFDMLVTSGGASVGPHDLVRDVQRELRVEEVFWGVAVKPGKPIAFGSRRGHLVFNLPGNPVSVLVTFELFVRPAVDALLGVPDPLPAFLRGTLAATLRRNAERDELVRAVVKKENNGIALEPIAGQESHMIVRAAEASALVLVEAGEGEVAAGDPVSFLPLS
ncbi:MAG TPA: gephyrin-like molybdotransferase Glp [Gaiellaceae bacterium]|nr:gephyrin-like molybdotransferase Glp [Gaiellaceae bacterium]